MVLYVGFVLGDSFVGVVGVDCVVGALDFDVVEVAVVVGEVECFDKGEAFVMSKAVFGDEIAIVGEL